MQKFPLTHLKFIWTQISLTWSKEIEKIYEVKVAKVNTMVVRGKRYSRYTKKGVTSGKAANYKKAIVTLKDGYSIDFYKNI